MSAPEHVKAIVDLTSIGTLAATLFDKLPAIAALFTIVWTVIRIYETKTVQRWTGKWRSR